VEEEREDAQEGGELSVVQLLPVDDLVQLLQHDLTAREKLYFRNY
jgi:hypothetical protein